ncbi:MAG: LysR family transcriptional regulator [Pseudomonas sp.]|uniref:LysR family transcriptional regulator n=1 Tax=Pseudomonas sp. TaxID=306 RepID=UPI003D0E8277
MLNRMEMVRIFCVAAESTTFREAAARLGVSPQSVTRAIKELETQLGEMLFHRNTRQIHITAFGEQLARQSRRTLESFDKLFIHSASPQGGELSGRVGITAPLVIGRLFLLPFLQPLLRQHPGLRVELRLEDQLTDSVEAKIDVGVRVGFMRDRRYIARSVAQVPFHVVGSPALVANTGEPKRIEDLNRLPLSLLIDRNTGRPWPWLFADNQVFQPDSAQFSTDDPEVEREAVLGGLAYGQLPSFLALEHIQSGRLQEVLPQHAPAPWELFIYRPQRGPVPARVRLVYDHLIACFSDPLRFPR